MDDALIRAQELHRQGGGLLARYRELRMQFEMLRAYFEEASGRFQPRHHESEDPRQVRTHRGQ
jgi:hypothetical protein